MTMSLDAMCGGFLYSPPHIAPEVSEMHRCTEGLSDPCITKERNVSTILRQGFGCSTDRVDLATTEEAEMSFPIECLLYVDP